MTASRSRGWVDPIEEQVALDVEGPLPVDRMVHLEALGGAPKGAALLGREDGDARHEAGPPVVLGLARGEGHAARLGGANRGQAEEQAPEPPHRLRVPD